ncbi:hypothetical protein KBC70_02305 [Candidatus Woesebacteria bacterium]|nr:hypothetical protein [Candidatus Woesebacteria bacterium]
MLVIFAGSVIQLATVQLFGYTKNIPPRLMIDTLIVGYLLIIVGLWFIRRDTIATDTLDDSENDEETDVVISTD